jgi:hypothetical protein
MATAPRSFSFQRTCKNKIRRFSKVATISQPFPKFASTISRPAGSPRWPRFRSRSQSLPAQFHDPQVLSSNKISPSQKLVAKILDPFHFNEPTNERPSGSLETLKGVRYKSRFENLSHFNAPPSIERTSGSHPSESVKGGDCQRFLGLFDKNSIMKHR